MSASAVPTLDARNGKLCPRLTLSVLDLTPQPQRHDLWASESVACPVPSPPPDLPAGGSVSSMGFWLYSADAAPPLGTSDFNIRVYELSERNTALSAPPPPSKRPGRLTQTVQIKAPGAGDLYLTIGPDEALVFANQGTWEALSEPVLLTICQYRRFLLTERKFEQFARQARRDRRHAVLPGFTTWLAHRHLVANDLAIRNFIDDWTHCAGLLSDPYRYCTSEKSVQAYQTLAEKLELEGWCERIEDRIDGVESTYEMISDKLFHYKLFVWGVILEVIIIALIAAHYFYVE